MGTDSTAAAAATTCLPWPGLRRAGVPPPRPRDLKAKSVALRVLARISLGCLVMLLVGAPACLITANPDFTPPARTRPEIITSDTYPPSPAVGKVALFQPTAPSSSYTGWGVGGTYATEITTDLPLAGGTGIPTKLQTLVFSNSTNDKLNRFLVVNGVNWMKLTLP